MMFLKLMPLRQSSVSSTLQNVRLDIHLPRRLIGLGDVVANPRQVGRVVDDGNRFACVRRLSVFMLSLTQLLPAGESMPLIA